MDPLGKSPGLESDPSIDDGLSNTYADISDTSVDTVSERVSPNQVTTGVTRGTQTIMNTDGSYIQVGRIGTGTEFGIAFYTASGNLISKNLGSTQYIYDGNNKNIIQIGKLPDGTYGIVVATPGNTVADIYAS